eukprot:8878274-Pyramimonas_sp.AAC.1
MGSYEQAMDVGKILLQALGDLKNIRSNLNEGVFEQGEQGLFTLDSALSEAEFSLRDKAEQLSE